MSVKKDYLHKLEVELSDWDNKINELTVLADKAKPEDKAEFIGHIEHLKVKQNLVRKQQEELEQAHESVWEGLKDGIDSIFDDMLSYAETLFSKFKD
ncbi:MAG: hypothetical protein D8M57_16670 [Candidatus Scalindua sp. AMX11]|nr:MAG: hypothetical protein DWQ00_06685 [Candidatus Scalindua sp.]NOG84248.1 hypothetical protein [Planctomycetota bacterium]RZV68281.1 MAG: hypothetical protein EX341_16555 [Candidatus Scalindua sp. SCAELEC01]TDE63773.1 MAG: hypothetical protein D8M57_16670 [Candidatus Scalindua sp. AMX11]GJQ60727.1 MAG: hypothetical protein SCALA701_35280 [Candidatus Scalindua sp.]